MEGTNLSTCFAPLSSRVSHPAQARSSATAAAAIESERTVQMLTLLGAPGDGERCTNSEMACYLRTDVSAMQRNDMFRYISSAALGSARSSAGCGSATADAAVADLGNNLEHSNEIACANALDMADFTCAACQQLLLHPVVVSLDRSKFI